MTIRYVNSQFVENKYAISSIELQKLIDWGILKGHKTGRNYLFRKDQLPSTLKKLYEPIITSTPTENSRSYSC